MKLKIINISIVLFIGTALIGCSKKSDYTIEELPNGLKVKIISISTAYLSNKEKALVLKYQTEYPIDDIPSIKNEVMKIWPYFEREVENSQLDSGVIQAATPSTGVLFKKRKLYAFAYKRDNSGNWIMQDK